jgi:hypothetical protein
MGVVWAEQGGVDKEGKGTGVGGEILRVPVWAKRR